MPLNFPVSKGSKLVLTIHSIQGKFEADLDCQPWFELLNETPENPQEWELTELPKLLDLTAISVDGSAFAVVYSIAVASPEGISKNVVNKASLKEPGTSSKGCSFKFVAACE